VNTLESFQQGLAVDLSNLKSVQIDEAAMTLTVGGGIRTRDIYGPVSQAGFWMRKLLRPFTGIKLKSFSSSSYI
jgi:FAD/FMN-containing dehydrogenase